MNSSHFPLAALRHAARTHPHASPLQLAVAKNQNLKPSWGVVEQLYLLLPATPTLTELECAANALSELTQTSIPKEAIGALWRIDEDTRRYAQLNQILLTIERDGLVWTQCGRYKISRSPDEKEWLLHLPEGEAPASNLWNAIFAARLCARGEQPGGSPAASDSPVA